MLRHLLCGILVAAAAVGSTRRVAAELIGVGLDWRSGIFVQETWHKGEPHYALANLSKTPVTITVHDFDSKWRLGQPLPKAQAGPWKVAPGKLTVVPAKALVGEQLRRFVVDGKTPLGVLSSPANPGYDGPDYATSLGLNGSGGAVAGVYLVQPKLEFAGGSKVTLILRLPGKSGVLKFNRAPEKSDDPLRPATLIVQSAVSITLPVTVDDKQITINSDAPLEDKESHQVELTLSLPKVKSAQLQMLDGWLARGAGGSGVTRGIFIVPE